MPSSRDILEVDTPHGRARAHVHQARDPKAALALGHGASGGVGSKDLAKATDVALEHAVTVALIEQPYRVAGRRAPAPAHQLDTAWTAVLDDLDVLKGLPLIAGGRSIGARVACRTAAETGAVGVLCLAFPLQPKRKTPAPSRLSELDAITVPTLVVQGARDPFGIPPAAAQRTVVTVNGDHSLRTDLNAVADAVGEWLARVIDTVPASADQT